MIFYTRPLLFAFLLSLGATAPGCKTPQKTAVAPSAPKAPKTPKKPVPAAAAPQVTAVTMSRGACFGKCPIYSIEMQNTGLVRYSGRRFVEKEGVFEKKFDLKSVNELLEAFTKARIDTMQESYERVISDLPSIDYAVSFSNGKTKYIQNAHFGPQVLSGLARQLDELVKGPDYSWKRTADKVTE